MTNDTREPSTKAAILQKLIEMGPNVQTFMLDAIHDACYRVTYGADEPPTEDEWKLAAAVDAQIALGIHA
jgi:hypothetical protein